MTVTETETREGQLLDTIELLQESLADALLAAEDASWISLATSGELLDREELRRAGRLARVMSVADPLIRRGVTLRTAYVWGEGVEIAAEQEEDAEQDVNGVVQDFLDDNKTTFTSSQAHEELERRLATDGNAFHTFPTDPKTGRVRVRVLPVDEVEDIICNPEDASEPWYYCRTYVARVVEQGYADLRTRRETRTVYYPALGYAPRNRPASLNGRQILWDMPVLHTYVNRPDGSQWGVPDVYSALPWARGYKGFLEDWAKLVKALSRIAFRASAKTRAGAAKIRSVMETPEDGPRIGGTLTTAEGQSFEAVNKSGATIDSESGRPLAAMVAAALDVPVTMLLGDPGVTGARATAETLDEPLRLVVQMRRSLHTTLIMTVLDYVIDNAIGASAGPLNGTRSIDADTGRVTYELAGEQERNLDVDWPELESDTTKDRIDAIVAADGTGYLPPLEVVRMLLVTLGVDDVDSILEDLVDDQGNFVAPQDTAAARAQQNAVAAGAVPPAEGGPQPPPAGDTGAGSNGPPARAERNGREALLMGPGG